ncbi:MAG: DUF4386 domain-containing protein [Candidatus Latescibacteria bacterium]|nr:DUF4386 domain-containing protein [Candidatus Latescibacterota bacterium]
MTNRTTETSPLIYARIAGALYLIIIICAGFSQGYVRSNLIVPGDATATANNIMASEFLFRVGFVSDLIAFLCDAVVSVLFYILLKPVNKTLSLIAASLRLLAHPAIASINLLNHFAALLLLSGADYLAAFEPVQLHSLALLFLNMHRYGYLIAGAFFGVHCFLLGYLLIKSDLFPGILGVLLVFASFGYLTESFTYFLFPVYEAIGSLFVVISASVAELLLCLWLLIKGVRVQQPVSVETS